MADAKLDIEGPAAPPRQNGELVFAAPWESRAFGLAVALEARGLFIWDEFRERLIAEIGSREGEPAEDWSYYTCWLAALERILVEKAVCRQAEIDDRETRFRARPAGHDH